MLQDRFSLKDALFNKNKVTLLAGWMQSADPGFPVRAFVSDVMARLPELELKARIDWIAECLIARLPPGFPDAADIVRAALPPPLDPTRTDDDFGDFIVAPLGVVVERLGLGDPQRALDLLEDITRRFSMEYSIRTFLNRWPDEVLARMEDWAGHENYHVRRLVSEGTRPRLPWGQRIGIAPGRALPLLDRLHADSTRYVTRSVSNHLNDLTKSDPAAVMERVGQWRAAELQDSKELDWMARHALRTLVRAGDPGALEMLGYRAGAEVALIALEVSPAVVGIGAAMEIAVTLRAARRERVIVDYSVDFARANGRRGERVFRLKDAEIVPDRTVTFRKRHVFKADATTFSLYPGPHFLHLQLNGRRLGQVAFELTGPERGSGTS
ncbi:hypothetical protein [Tropicimonas sp.]|uniref:hypothetical protein n=1 Tax=Tropicimonas sp. TaxID=2067044 RepID=UPI003A86C8A6